VTFCLAFAARDWALVASDTRAVYWAGQVIDDDPTVEKLYRLPGGWCTGGGWTTLRETAIAALASADLRNPETVLTALRDARPAIEALLDSLDDVAVAGLSAAELGGSMRENAAGCTQLTTIATARDRFVSRMYDFGTATLLHEIEDAVYPSKPPAGLSDDDVRPEVTGLAMGLGLYRPNVEGGIRMVAGTFRDVRAKMRQDCVTISGTVTFGLLTRDADGAVQAARLPPMPHAWFLKRSDDEIQQRLEPSPDPAPHTEDLWAATFWHPTAG